MTQKINAAPAKRFFVEMLTRDIDLKDSILDLLDNCIDGVMRERHGRGAVEASNPYEGYEARITFDENSFSIIDNCGGIPQPVALERAFRMGRPSEFRDADNDIPTVGVYGIGMKRAIFKMGRKSCIVSHASDASYQVDIGPDWIDDDTNWDLDYTEIEASKTLGTSIKVEDLYPGIGRLFSDQTGFFNDLSKSIAAYYGNIIAKGFSVYVNNTKIIPINASFILSQESFNGGGIAPYVYIGDYHGVNIELVVGFYRNLPSPEEQEDSLQGRPSTEQAGWTIICNDRVVLYADKTKVTGWGEAGVPQYHTQFVSIGGVVNFRANDASRLPVTTTKRGIDGNSDLYLSVKEFMREGVKLFTDYTNKWKGPVSTRPEFNQPAVTASTRFIADLVPQDKWSQDRKSVIKGSKFKPILPVPEREDENKVIRFFKPLKEIRELSVHFFDDPDATPSEVGAACFEEILKRT